MSGLKTIVFFAALLLPTLASAIDIQFAEPSRTSNSLGQRLAVSQEKGRFNLQDCRDKETVAFRFRVTVEESEQVNRYVGLYTGEGCTETPIDTSRCRSILDLTHTGEKIVPLTIAELFGEDLACSGTGDVRVFAAALRSKSDFSEFWDPAEAVTISYDMDPPDPVAPDDAGAGDAKVTVSWSGVADAGETAVYILRFPGTGSAVDQGDTDKGDTDLGDTDAADAGDDPDAGDDTDTDTDTEFPSLRKQSIPPIFAASEEGEVAEDDTEEPPACPNPDGGFFAGDAFDPTGGGDYFTSVSFKSSPGTVTDLTNGTPYKFGLVVKDSFNNYSPVSETVCAVPGETDDFWEIYKDAGGEGGKFCFVATAAFGSYDHPAVQLLRMFRDRFLAAMPGGTAVIAAYYRVGPGAAAFIQDRPALRAGIVGFLTIAAGLTLPFSLLGPLGTLFFSLFLFGAIAVLRVRRRRAGAARCL